MTPGYYNVVTTKYPYDYPVNVYVIFWIDHY